jgi:hypothetical protein
MPVFQSYQCPDNRFPDPILADLASCGRPSPFTEWVLFQEDFFSPLFCLCCTIVPCPKLAKRLQLLQPSEGYHLSDDLKRDKKSRAVCLVEGILTVMGIKLGLKKCAVAHVVSGRVVQVYRVTQLKT